MRPTDEYVSYILRLRCNTAQWRGRHRDVGDALSPAFLSLSPPAKVLGTFSTAVRLAPFTILLISKAEKTGL